VASRCRTENAPEQELKLRASVVGIFPRRYRRCGWGEAILFEQDDEWAVADRRYFSAEL
jgi:hypothetical protein